MSTQYISTQKHSSEKREQSLLQTPRFVYADKWAEAVEQRLTISKMNNSMLQDENNDALDWVSEEEVIQFKGGEHERDDSDLEEGVQDEDSEVEDPVSARRRGDARPAVPVDFPLEVPLPPFEPFSHPQQAHERRILLPSDLVLCYVSFFTAEK
jgi:hypothetical protein